MQLAIDQPPLFSFKECLWFLNRNYDDCLHHIETHKITKLVELSGQPVLFQLSEKQQQLQIKVLNHSGFQADELTNYIREWLDMDKNIAPFYQLLSQEKDLAFMPTDYHGLRLIAIPDLFEALCWSIIGQQINLSFAYRCKRNLVEKYGYSENYEGMPFYLFPKPAVLANLQENDLRQLQFSQRKAEYLIGVARLFETGEINKQSLLGLKSEEKIIQELIKIRGIGEWTANYAMMKSLKCPNALTYGDVGIYNALHQIKCFPKRPERQQLDAFFEPFDNWKAYLVLYLWRSLS